MLSNIYNRFRRITTNQLYFPEIDGIRFLAIILVVLFHTHGYFIAKSPVHFADDPASYHLLNTLFFNGDRGVELFFVLSGFILCLPFAHHYINHGKKIQLSKYYLRRVTRLEPPYFIAMIAIFCMHLVLHTRPPGELFAHLLASLGYAHNIIYHTPPIITVVAWSLEIEIQFYLFAPILFSLLALHRVTRRVVLLALTVLLILLQSWFPPSFSSIYGFGQYFLVGILLADFYVSDTAAALFSKKWIPFAALLLLIAIVYWPIKGQAADTLLYAHLAFPFMLALFYYVVLKNAAVKRVFSYKFVPIIGGMCYSIYLLHYTIISFFGRFTIRFHFTDYYLPNLALQLLLLSIPVLVLSSVFYLYIERPFMSRKWMDKLMKKDRKHEETNTQADTTA